MVYKPCIRKARYGLPCYCGKLLKEINQTIDKYGLKKRHFAKHIPQTEKFHQQFIEATHKSDLATKYQKRLKKHWPELWTFLSHDNVPWNNNNVEAAIKDFAQYCRGVNGQVSQRGMNWFLPMLSLSQTCRYRNISFLDFLRKKKGIWHNISPSLLPGYLPFNQTKLYVHSQKIQNKRDWNKNKRENNLPCFIPADPDRIYKLYGWKDWENWLA